MDIFFLDYRDLTAKIANDSQVPECKCFVFYVLNWAAKIGPKSESYAMLVA